MRDIFELGNPYSTQYSEWDYWLWANARDLPIEERIEWNRGTPPAGWQLLTAEVDETGYPLPLTESLREVLTLSRDNPTAFIERCRNQYSAYAPLEPALETALRRELVEVEAPFRPAIPRWLAEAPPRHALILPDGRVVTQGLLGSGVARTEVSAATRAASAELADSQSHLYSAQGELLDSLDPGLPWWQMTFPEHAIVFATYGADVIALFSGGMLFLRDGLSRTQLAVYDYSGARLPDDISPYSANLNHWQPLSAAELPLLYAAQQRQ